jgi:ketosteroid isomerase-like protein
METTKMDARTCVAVALTLAFLGYVAPLLGCQGAPLAQPTSESEVLSAHEAYWRALVTEGPDVALERFYADVFTYVGVDGLLIDKPGLKARMKRNQLANLELKDDLRRLTVYGVVAVISGQSESVVRDKGQARTATEGYTEVWVKRGEGWKLVAEQVTVRRQE